MCMGNLDVSQFTKCINLLLRSIKIRDDPKELQDYTSPLETVPKEINERDRQK